MPDDIVDNIEFCLLLWMTTFVILPREGRVAMNPLILAVDLRLHFHRFIYEFTNGVTST